MHPLVGERIGAFLGSLPAGTEIAVVEVPLLFESGMEGVFDTSVAVVTSDEVRRARAEARGHALVGEREARQLDQDEKAERADARDRERRHARGPRAGAVRAGREAEGMKRKAPAPAPGGGRRHGRRGRAVVAGLALGVVGKLDKAIQELTLPLRHEDIIRQQAEEKGVDASLIAAVIYSESRFRDQTSEAGARGLMQITPEAAKEIERLSGGTTFELEDLSRSRNQHPLRHLPAARTARPLRRQRGRGARRLQRRPRQRRQVGRQRP